jgi:hypothetical protein
MNNLNHVKILTRGINVVAAKQGDPILDIKTLSDEALSILSEPPTRDNLDTLKFLLSRIEVIISEWRPSPSGSGLYFQPSWASSIDRDVVDALRFLAEFQTQPHIDDTAPSVAKVSDAVSSLGTKMSGHHPDDLVRIFISHSSADKDVAEAFANLLRAALPITGKDIRCTSVDGYKLQAGADSDAQLKQEVLLSTVFVGLLSPTSLKSVYVLFELGARWGAKRYFAPIMVGGLGTDALKAPLSGIHCIRGDHEADMHDVIRHIANQLHLDAESPAGYVKPLRTFLEAARAPAALDGKSSPNPEQIGDLRKDVLDTVRSLRKSKGKAVAMEVVNVLSGRYEFEVVMSELLSLRAEQVLTWNGDAQGFPEHHSGIEFA